MWTPNSPLTQRTAPTYKNDPDPTLTPRVFVGLYLGRGIIHGASAN
jgi:hypothetical protein